MNQYDRPPRDRTTVLFVCTGNYYRSRFAASLFHAQSDDRFEARSAGFAPTPENVGDVSPLTLDALAGRRIDLHEDGPPRRIDGDDVLTADVVVVLDEDEHRATAFARFPDHAHGFRFWRVPDLDRLPSADAFAALEEAVTALIDELTR